MKLRIVRTLDTGLPDRLVGTVVDAVRVERGYRLTDRKNNYLIVDDRWIGEGKQVTIETEPEAVWPGPWFTP